MQKSSILSLFLYLSFCNYSLANEVKIDGALGSFITGIVKELSNSSTAKNKTKLQSEKQELVEPEEVTVTSNSLSIIPGSNFFTDKVILQDTKNISVKCNLINFFGGKNSFLFEFSVTEEQFLNSKARNDEYSQILGSYRFPSGQNVKDVFIYDPHSYGSEDFGPKFSFSGKIISHIFENDEVTHFDIQANSGDISLNLKTQLGRRVITNACELNFVTESRTSIGVELQNSSNSYQPNSLWIQPLSKTKIDFLNYEFFKANEFADWLRDYIYDERFNISRQNIRDAKEILAKLNSFGYELLVGKIKITDVSPEVINPLINSYKAKDSEIYWDIKLFSKEPLKFKNIQCAYISKFPECYGQFGNLTGVKEKTVAIVSFNNFWKHAKDTRLYSGDVLLFSGEMLNPFYPVIGENTVNIPVANLDEIKLIMEEKIFYPGISTLGGPESRPFFEDNERIYRDSISFSKNNFFFIK